jgi:hypothetical protein
MEEERMNILELEPVRAIRQNHAVEHATMHMLARHDSTLQLVGRSTGRGFMVYGRVDTELLASAVSEALSRLQAGEHELAVHPRCGTGIATAGILSGLTAFVLLGTRRRRSLAALPRVLIGTTLAVLAAQPLGLIVQREFTTDPEVEGVSIKDIRRHESNGAVVHHVELEHD